MLGELAPELKQLGLAVLPNQIPLNGSCHFDQNTVSNGFLKIPKTWSFLMARVTVEDCVDKVPNRFDLVMLAAHRAREISSGSELTVPRDNDKNPVVALREIADETLSAANLHEAAVQSYQTQIEVDEPEEDEMALLMGGADDEPDDGMNDENLLRSLMEAQEAK